MSDGTIALLNLTVKRFWNTDAWTVTEIEFGVGVTEGVGAVTERQLVAVPEQV